MNTAHSPPELGFAVQTNLRRQFENRFPQAFQTTRRVKAWFGPIPRLSKAGMPSRSEDWGGLFKVEQYRLIKERFAGI